VGGQAHLLAARSVLSPEQIKLMPAWLNNISSAHGSISAAYFAPNAADRPLVVHIQDVHEQQEAQMNISGLISELVNTGAVSLVGLEGATGAFDLVPYRTFPNKAVIGDVADFFLQEHLIGGGEHAGWTMEKEPTLWGIEEVNVYLKNLNSFKESLPIQQRVQDRIKSWEYRLAQAKPKVYSPALKSFDDAQARYRTGSMPLPDFVALMEKSVKIEEKKYPAMAAFKKCLAMEKGIDFADVERERARLIESLTKALSEKEISALVQRTLLYKSGHLTYGGYYDSLQSICETRGVSLSRFPAMAAYIKYVLASEQIKPEALLEELDLIQDHVASTLVRSADERAVYDAAQDLHSLANLTAFKMAPRDWEIYQRTRDRIMNMAARMDQVAPGADNFKGDLPKDLVSFEGFCQAALKRDETLVNNLLAKMKETNQKTGLLLAGGFHTQGMTDLLKKGKVSYVVFTPTLTEVSSDFHYLDFLKDRPALEKLFTQEKITTKAPITSADAPVEGYGSAKESVGALTRTLVEAVSGGEVTPAIERLSSVIVQKTGDREYTGQGNGQEVTVVVGPGSKDRKGVGSLVAAFTGKVSEFAVFEKEHNPVGLLNPFALIAKFVEIFSGPKGPPTAGAVAQNRNFMKTGQLVIGGLGLVAASVSIFGFTLAALGSAVGFGLLGVLLHEVAGHLGVYSFLGGKGGKLMFGREGVWAQTDDLGFRKNAWVAIAGPLANIFFAAVAGLLIWAGVDGSALQAFAATNLVFGMTTLLPIGKGSDIENIFSSPEISRILDDYAAKPYPVVLQTGVQNYAWGQRGEDAFIPNLLGIPAGDSSYAEVWIGAHPDLPSTAVLPKGARIRMDRLVERAGNNLMSPNAAALYNGQLPFLFKVLAAGGKQEGGRPLSIQGHPNREQAQAGFEKENNEGIDIKAKNRNYRDPNHKPEQIVAVTEFYGLRGFKPLNEIAEAFTANSELMTIPGASDFVSYPSENNLKILYGNVMGLPKERVEAIISPLIQRLGEVNNRIPYPKSSAEYWVLRCYDTFSMEEHREGIFSIYFLNLMRLKPDQAMYLSAGVLHAYLEGVGMEIMANSNNVLRGGLTDKHVDVPELMNTVVFQGEPPAVRDGVRVSETETVYRELGDVPEFQLSRINISRENAHVQPPLHDVETLIVLEAEHPLVLRMDDASQLTLTRGQTVLIPRGIGYRLLASKGEATLFRATVPMQPISMDGMAYDAKEQKANEIFNQLQMLSQQTGISQQDRVNQIRSIVIDLFELQRDGNLGDVQHIANLVDIQLQNSGRLDEVQRLFSRAFNVRYKAEKEKIDAYNQGALSSPYAIGGLDTNGKENMKLELLSRLHDAKNQNRYTSVAQELNRLDPRDGLEILESMVKSLRLSNDGVPLAIGLLRALGNEINGATIKTFNAGRLQQLITDLSPKTETSPAQGVTGTAVTATPKAPASDEIERLSTRFSQLQHEVPIAKLADTLNSSLKFIAAGKFKSESGPNGQIYGPANRGEALAELRSRLYESLADIQNEVVNSFNLSASAREYALNAQTIVMDALFIVDLMERGVKGADRIRLTTNPSNQLTATNRAPSFLERKTLPVEVSNEENGIGAYNRGIETGLKMAADLTGSTGQAPRNLDAYVLYAMRHGLVPVPQGLRSITRATGGAVSTFHHTVFGMRNVPQSSGAASTGVGHFQANQLDIKQVTRGEAIQVLVAYNADGSVRDVLYQRAKAGEYLTALPGYYDYMITTGNEPVEFDDISINLSQLGFTADQIAQFKGGVQPTNLPQKAPYVYVNGKLAPAAGLSGQVPPIREIASVQAHQGASLLDVYGLLDEASLKSVAQSLVGNAASLVATTYRGRQPKPLAFGTSGLRGLVTEITDLEVYINTLGYLNYLQGQGQIKPGDQVVIARDFRDSSPRIAAAVSQAISDFGAQVVDLGRLSTPALTLWGIQNKVVSVMITGSHIPFDRNGIKFNKASGEVVKADEPGINQQVALARESQYRKAPSDSLFNDAGNFKKTPENRLIDVGADRSHDSPYVNKWTTAQTPINDNQRRRYSDGEEAYINRYVSVYGANALAGQNYSVYLHSGVGTRLFAEILRRLGANVYEFGPSDKFIAIDTEAIGKDTLASISQRVEKIPQPQEGALTAVLSTDGDSDRPLVLGVNGAKRELDFIPGDIAGAFVAGRINAAMVAIPISSNDNVDTFLEGVRIVKTKIGSPYIVVAMKALADANPGKTIVGWEANGGFLTGVEISHRNGTLAALPTRDAVLPMVEILVAAKEGAKPVSGLFESLRNRFGRADLIDNFPVPVSAAIVSQFSLVPFGVSRVVYNDQGKVKVVNTANPNAGFLTDMSPATEIRSSLQQYFSSELGFGQIDWIDFTDGIRIHFTNNDIAHIRPSGNAPQLRIYAVADTPERANQIVEQAIGENGIYRQIQSDLGSETGPQSVVGRFGPASSLLSVKAKPFSVVRVAVKMLLAWGAAAVTIVYGATGLAVVFPVIVASIYTGLWIVSGTILFSTSMDRLIAEGDGYSERVDYSDDYKAISEWLTRLGYAPKMIDGQLTVKMGKKDVTVNIGFPKGGTSWLAETTNDGRITVRPGIPGWLLPFVLRTEIYRVSLWEGAKTDLLLLPHLMRSSVTTRGPPVVDSTENRVAHLDALRKIAGNNEGPVNVIAIVNGGDGKFVGDALSDQKEDLFRSDGRTSVMAFEESPSRGQFFGLLAAIRAWKVEHQGQGLDKDHVSAGIMMPGKGTRMSPLTQWAFGIKPFIPMLIRAGKNGPWLSAAAASIFSWTLVTSRLEALGFRGIAWKWGDEPQIASRLMESFNEDLSNTDAIRVGQATEMPSDIGQQVRSAQRNASGKFDDENLNRLDDLAQNKEWLVVDRATGKLLLDIRRRPLEQLIALKEKLEAERGVGTIELLTHMGSPAFSYALIDAADQVYDQDVSDTSKTMDVDGFLFAALTMPAELWNNDVNNGIIVFDKKDSNNNFSLAEAYYKRVQELKAKVNQSRGKEAKADLDLRVLNMGRAPYWGDIGQLAKARDSVWVVNDRQSPDGDFARRMAMIDDVQPDQWGNIVVGNSQYPQDGSVRNSVIIDSFVRNGIINGAVIVNSQIGQALISEGAVVFDSTVEDLAMGRKSYAHGVLSGAGAKIYIPENYAQTTIPINPSDLNDGFQQWRADMAVDVGKTENYDNARFENPGSFASKAKQMRGRETPVGTAQENVNKYRQGLATEIEALATNDGTEGSLRPAQLSVVDQPVPEVMAQRYGRKSGVRVEPAKTRSELPSFIRFSVEGTGVPSTARSAGNFASLTAEVFLRANAYWTDAELADFTSWARTPKNQKAAQKIFLDVAFTLARLHGHSRTATGSYSVERQRNEMIALAVLSDQMGMSDEVRSNALDLYSREAAVQTIAARNNKDGVVADVRHQFMPAPVVRGEDGSVKWDPAAGEEGIKRWKKELMEAEEKRTVTLFLMSGDTSVTPSELEDFLRAEKVESRGPMQGTFFVHQGNYLTADGRIDFGNIVSSLAPVHKTLTSGSIAIVSMYENRFSFDNMPEGFSRDNLVVYIINMLGKLTQAGTSIENDVNSLKLSFIAA
jgi:phosphomannomutase